MTEHIFSIAKLSLYQLIWATLKCHEHTQLACFCLSLWRLSVGLSWLWSMRVSHASVGNWNTVEQGNIFIDQVWCFTFPLYHRGHQQPAQCRFHPAQCSLTGSCQQKGRLDNLKLSVWPGGGLLLTRLDSHRYIFCVVFKKGTCFESLFVDFLGFLFKHIKQSRLDLSLFT